jgi:hypothetical protein
VSIVIFQIERYFGQADRLSEKNFCEGVFEHGVRGFRTGVEAPAAPNRNTKTVVIGQ